MFSSPRAEPSAAGEGVRRPGEGARGRWQRRLAGVPLRTRLLAALMALLAVVCVVIGVVTEVAVYRFQVGQLDDQLAAAADRTATFGQRPPDGRQVPPGPQPQQTPLTGAPGQASGTLVARIADGRIVEAGVLDVITGERLEVPVEQYPVLTGLPVDRRPYTASLGGLGDYRLIAARGHDGDVLITGLPLAGVYAIRYQLIAIETAVGLTAAVLAALLGTLIIRRTLRPLRRVASTAGRVAQLPLDRGEVALSERVPEIDTDPRTEVGQVGAALNRMLGHVGAALAARQASETRLRHFVADASHELRTPLAAIRGYAELTRRSRAAVPPDVAHALRRVESETARMTALVEDLLLLARLDSGRPLANEPVDLSRLVIDAVSDAHVAGPEHRWQLDLPDSSVSVLGDTARLHQVLANLLANARTHTPAGTTVTSSLMLHNGHVVLCVVDDGPGIPAELLPEVFDRFTRADTSRSRAAGSSGLGLSIVAAVVEAHRGSVEATSQPGRTAISVRLPVAG